MSDQKKYLNKFHLSFRRCDLSFEDASEPMKREIVRLGREKEFRRARTCLVSTFDVKVRLFDIKFFAL